MMAGEAALHDAYAAGYDDQLAAYEAYTAEALFGLCYPLVRPGQRLLDLGIGSGLPAAFFERAGLRVDGLDFSAAMLDLCRAKGIGADLRRHDLLDVPWPYDGATYDHVTCCGVLHFIADPRPVFGEAARVLRPGGLFAFTTKAPPDGPDPVHHTRAGAFDIYGHAPDPVTAMLDGAGFRRLRFMRCFVGDDIFHLWVARAAAWHPAATA